MFPYPSGAGLHVGHPEGYTATDIVARHKRMTGHNVLHPIGWDAFGLPAEQYAIQTGTHPAVTTAKNVARFKGQLKALGFSYDWGRELSTADPAYYKWTQWIFVQLFNRGLAYQAEVPVNWCPALGTVLANEEVVGGVSERGGHPVVRLPMKQWMLRITAYADRLLEGLDGLEWDESIKARPERRAGRGFGGAGRCAGSRTLPANSAWLPRPIPASQTLLAPSQDMQRNWIGRSEGADVTFALAPGPGAAAAPDATLTVFTTRPDTLFGVTYVCVAPEHPLAAALASGDAAGAVAAYAAAAAAKSDLERTELAKVKTGVFTGSYAINPANGEKVPGEKWGERRGWAKSGRAGGRGAGPALHSPQRPPTPTHFCSVGGGLRARIVRVGRRHGGASAR